MTRIDKALMAQQTTAAQEAPSSPSRVLATVTLGTMGSISVLLVALALIQPAVGWRAGQALVALNALGLLTLLLGAQGRHREGAWLFLLGFLALVTANAWQAGGIMSPGMFAYLVLPTMAAVLLGFRAALLMTLLGVVSAATLTLASATHRLPPSSLPYNELARLLLLSLYAIIGLLLIQQVTSALRHALRHAHLEIGERRAAEGRLRLALESAAIGVWRADLGLASITADKRSFELFGISMPSNHTIPLERWQSLIHDDDRETLRLALRGVIDGGHPMEMDIRTAPIDGAERQLHVSAARLSGTDGDHLVGMVIDMTERSRIRDELSRLESILRATINSTNDLIWVVDARDFRVIQMNDAFNAYFQDQRGMSVMGRNSEECFPESPERAAQWQGMFERALRAGSYTTEYVTSAGGIVLELHFGLLQRNGKAFGISVFGRNITARLTAEQTARTNEQRFRRVFSDSPVAIGAAIDGKTVMVNDAYARMFGYRTPDELTGMPIASQLAPAERAQILARHEARLAGVEVPTDYETMGLRRDGTTFPVHVMMKSVDLPEGKASLGFFTDLTEIRRVEAEREQIESQLHHAQQMEAIGTLAAGIAHDFNNVLTPIIGYSQMARDATHKGDPLHGDVEAILSASHRAKDLVQQILLLSRARDDRDRSPIDVGPIVKETVKLLRAAIPSTIQIQTQIEETGRVMGNATQLHQVILNLCTNARDAILEKGPKGVLTLQLRALPPDDALLVSARNNHPDTRWICLSVRDTGCGIAQEIQHKIFEPYFTTKPRGKGTGLGLAVSHGIVTGMGGMIHLTSVPNEGTTFHVVLPISKEIEEGKPAEVLVPRGDGQRVLVVDDELPVRLLLDRVLRSLGYAPVVFDTPMQVLDMLRSSGQPVHALVTDQTMPIMTGSELANRCRQERPDLKVVICTGDADVAGALPTNTVVLHKPFRIEDVARALHTAFT